MNRNQFFTVLGVSAGTVIFAPFLASCSKSSTLPTDPGTGGGGVDFTLDLTLPANSALNANGGYLTSNSVIVARTSAGTYAAVSAICTHQGAALAFDNANTRFRCTNPAAGHGSVFSTTGSVVNGPAVTALKMYNTTLTGTSLRVYA
jgi:cytochrome b6-f complex iron-sulfur subunit